MKRLDEHTNAELTELSEEEITSLINLECAHQGAPLTSAAAPAAPVKPDVAPDVPCYIVDIHDLRYATSNEANKVVQFLNNTRRLERASLGKSSWSGPYQLVPTSGELSIKGESHWTGEHYKKHQEELEKYEVDKNSFDARQKEFRKDREAHDDVCSAVALRIDDAREELRMCEEIRSQFVEYCGLANNDPELALTFLLKATPYEETLVRTTLNMEQETIHGEESIQESSDEV